MQNKINIKTILIVLFLVYTSDMYAQKWYTHSVSKAINTIDTSIASKQIRGSITLLERITKARPKDAISYLYLSIAYAKLSVLENKQEDRDKAIYNNTMATKYVSGDSASMECKIITYWIEKKSLKSLLKESKKPIPHLLLANKPSMAITIPKCTPSSINASWDSRLVLFFQSK